MSGRVFRISADGGNKPAAPAGLFGQPGKESRKELVMKSCDRQERLSVFSVPKI